MFWPRFSNRTFNDRKRIEWSNNNNQRIPTGKISKIKAVSRREFLADSCLQGASLFFGTYTITVLAGCSDNGPTGPEDGNGNGNGNGGHPVVITVDISLNENKALSTVGGTLALGSNALDSQGILLVRVSETKVNAFSRRCTHQGCTIGAFTNGISTCPCHGSQFSTNGNVAGGPAPSSLQEYTATIEGTLVTITR